jgi:hypothetical protein
MYCSELIAYHHCLSTLRGQSRFAVTIFSFDEFLVSLSGKSFEEAVLSPLERQGLPVAIVQNIQTIETNKSATWSKEPAP